MMNVASRYWSPYAAGAGLGVLSWIAFATADRGLGITSAFETTAALVLGKLGAGEAYFTSNAPKIDWEWMLVAGVFAGSLASSLLTRDRAHPTVPRLWRERFGDSRAARVTAAFAGGLVMMIGARLARGCTSGHGITGALQLAAASWAFIVVAFGVAIATASMMFGRTSGPSTGSR
jgi:uncharacterized protein